MERKLESVKNISEIQSDTYVIHTYTDKQMFNIMKEYFEKKEMDVEDHDFLNENNGKFDIDWFDIKHKDDE